ncbi:hypothetical protein L7F22_056175 [Adiantum nelumboides]|nr:hypothetical protein [Adiantum nelumboides]
MDQVAHGELSTDDRHHMRQHEAEDVDGDDKANIHGIPADGNRTAANPSTLRKHISQNEDVVLSTDKLAVHTKHMHPHEDAGSPHERSASHGMHMPDNDGHTDITYDSPKSASSRGKHSFHESDVVVTNEHNANNQVHVIHTRDNEGSAVMEESREKMATHEKDLPDDGHAGLAHDGNGHCKHIHAQGVPVLNGTGELSTAHGNQHANADGGHFSVEAKHRLDAEEGSSSNTLTPPRHNVHEGDSAGVFHEHRYKQENDRDDAQQTAVLHEHGVKCHGVDYDCESKRAFSEESSSRERVHFSRGSTPDVDSPTQGARTSKPLKSGKGVTSTERGPGSADGNAETPSTSWAFSARASIAPSKFDHMATLRMIYGAYKESSQGREGVPLSLV